MSEEKVYTEQELKAMADQLLADADAAEAPKSAKPAKKRASRKKEGEYNACGIGGAWHNYSYDLGERQWT